MRPIVTREAVESAIKVIKERGERVTIERIRAITGGSPKTIGNIRNAIESGGNNDSSMLPLFDNNAVTGLSYHNVEKRMNTIITKRVNAIVMQQLNTILSRLEGVEEVKNGPQPQVKSDDTKELAEGLGEMRELWLDACSLFSAASREVNRLDKEIAKWKGVAELETESDHLETGQRVFKDELALAVHYLVMTAGKSQKEVAELLGIDSSTVSSLKNRGTKLRRKKK